MVKDKPQAIKTKAENTGKKNLSKEAWQKYRGEKEL